MPRIQCRTFEGEKLPDNPHTRARAHTTYKTSTTAAAATTTTTNSSSGSSNKSTDTDTHTRWEPQTRTKQESGERKLLRSCRAALDVFRWKKNRHSETHTHIYKHTHYARTNSDVHTQTHA